ncbi:hypothetical protein FPV67DRAFT_1491066 [Lyophyllum atratum]|nr:hypothetical protein FPV67DRAFT_1491066 [Lyophyllum atratum]
MASTSGFHLRGRTMAVACVTVIATSLGAMYFMGLDTKEKEGYESPYKHGAPGGTDMRMNSSDVAAAVSVPKPGKERLPHQPESDPRRR